MKTKSPKFDADELNLITLAQQYSDKDKARKLLESLRWPNGPVCPHCKNTGDEKKGVVKLTPKATSKSPARKGLYFCGACRKQFTVTVGTVFESSHIPINKWLMCWFIMCSSKKSISALQMQRMLGVSYRTAWFMCHRIRFALSDDGIKLNGVVEVDETFVGGKGDIRTRHLRHTPVVALIERGGAMKTRVVSNVTQLNLGKALNECVSKDAVVNTDEHGAYRNPLKNWKAHHTVVHSKFEYSRENKDGSKASINSCESFFSLLKRGVYGAWHCVSREHLQKYSDEFAFRWNTRELTDGARMVAGVPLFAGKRLMLRQPAN